MDHEFVVRTLAVERYFLNEMTIQQREEFEEHFFSCAKCANEVRFTGRFVSDVRLALAQARPSPSSGWLSSLGPRIAIHSIAAALMVLVAYQNAVTIPALKTPQSMASVVILDGPARASLPRLRAGEPLRLQAALSAAGGDRLTIELTDASGKVVRRGSVESPEPNQPLDVYFPGRLNPGRYTFVVRAGHRGRSGQELVRDRFEIVPGERKANE